MTSRRLRHLAIFASALLLLAAVAGCLFYPPINTNAIRERLATAQAQTQSQTQTPTPRTRIVRETVIVIATPTPAQALPVTGWSQDDSPLLIALYERANRSVVNIAVTTKTTLDPEHPTNPNPPDFLDPEDLPEDFYRQGEGSGFVFDQAGHIVTNNHVVATADEVRVTFYDGLSVRAEVVGADPDSDLAVIRVDVAPERLHPLGLADSSVVRVGQRVVAIGNPFGLEGTMTTGIVSALGRLLPAGGGTPGGGRYSIPDIIQTDAAINPGNSGGPLIDYAGRVVGVNTAIESPIRAFSGVGFAIPSDIVRQVVPVLIETGEYEHPWLGISGTSLNPLLAEAMGLDEGQRGVLVILVIEDSPAEEARLKGSDKEVELQGQPAQVGGDIIVGIDDVPVNQFDDLISYLVRRTRVDQVVSLQVLRDGEVVEVDVTLAPRP